MNITLSATTVAVVTACFISIAVGADTKPEVVNQVTSDGTMSVFAVSPVHTITETIGTSGSFSIYVKDESSAVTEVTSSAAEINMYAVQAIPKQRLDLNSNIANIICVFQPALFVTHRDTVASQGYINIPPIKHEHPEVINKVTSSGYCAAELRYYDLQLCTAYFKHNVVLPSYEVIAVYNNVAIFGTIENINVVNLSNELRTQDIGMECWHIQGIPQVVKNLLTQGHVQVFAKDTLIRHNHSIITHSIVGVFAKDKNIIHVQGCGSHGASDIRYGNNVQISRTENAHTLLGNFTYRNNPGLGDGVNNTAISASNILPIAGDNKLATYIHTNISQADMNIMPYKLVQDIFNTLISQGHVTLYAKDMLVAHNHSIASIATAQVPVTKDENVVNIQGCGSHGASDMVHGNNVQISRTETLSTALGNFSYRNNPGLGDGVFNETISASIILSVAGNNKEVMHIHNVITQADMNIMPYKLTQNILNTLISQGTAQVPVTEDKHTVSLHGCGSHGASDMIYGSNVQVSRTDNAHTLLGNFTYRNNPGLGDGVSNEVITIGNILPIVGANKEGTHIQNVITQADMNIMPYKLAQNIVNTLIPQGHMQVPIPKDAFMVGMVSVSSKLGGIQLINHAITEAVQGCGSHGASDMVHGNNVQISRTETLSTALGNFSYNRILGFSDGVFNEVITAGVMLSVVGSNKLASGVLNVSTAMVVNTTHANRYIITLQQYGGSGGTTSIVTVAGFYLDPTFIVPPTQTHYTFKGYYTTAVGGVQIINSSGVYVALTDSTYLNNVTLHAQWIPIQYNIIWRGHAANIIRQDVLTHSITSHAPATTADTAQWNYIWPVAFVVVTGNQTIQETRTIRSYTITWNRWTGAPTVTTQTLVFGTTLTPPPLSVTTVQHSYSWPSHSLTVIGTETINEIRTVRDYTITWAPYSGAPTLEVINYGLTSHAPIGTLDTFEWDYSWPLASVVVSGNQTIQEIRTAKSYTLTFTDHGGSIPNPVSKGVTFNSPYGALATIAKPGQEFLGWSNTFDTFEKPSLLAHWPLDGNVNDISGNSHHGVNNGVTWGQGKIGLAGYFSSNNNITIPNEAIPTGNEITVSFWYRETTSHSSALIEVHDGLSNRVLNISMYWAVPNIVFFACGNNGASSSDHIAKNTNSTIVHTEWHHWTFTKNAVTGVMKIYLNGVLWHSGIGRHKLLVTSNNAKIGSSARSTHFLRGVVNDFRIYDRELTANQVYEIAQAKVLHYTFNDSSIVATTNIFPRAYNVLAFISAFDGVSYGFGSATNMEQVFADSLHTSFSSRITKVSRITSGVSQLDFVHVRLHSPLNSTRVASFWYYGTFGTQIAVYNNDQCAWLSYLSISGVWVGWHTFIRVPVVVNKWQKITIRIVNKGTIAGTGWSWVIMHENQRSSVLSNIEYWAFAEFQYEERDHATKYVRDHRPNSYVKDHSAFQHNSQVLNPAHAPEWRPESPRGIGSFKFKAQRIFYPTHLRITERLTLACWVHPDVARESGFIQNHFYLSCGSDMRLRAFWAGTSPPGYHVAPGTIPIGQWTHVAATWTGDQVVLYQNGVEVKRVNTQTPGLAATYVAIGTEWVDWPPTSARQIHGNIDDVRIYATALSHQDIIHVMNEQTKIYPTTIVTTSKDHNTYAHWNPTTVESVVNNVASHGASDIIYGNDIQVSRTESAHTLLGAMNYQNQTVFTITLNDNGGTGGTATISGSTGINIIPASITIPTRTNYTYTGHYTATTGGIKYINSNGTYNNLNSNTFVGNVTLFAQWVINQIHFDWNPLPNNVGLRADVSINGVLQANNAFDWWQTRPANSVFKISGLTIPIGWAYSHYNTHRLINLVIGGSGSTIGIQGTGDMTQTLARNISITIVGILYSISVNQNGGSGSSASINTYRPKNSMTNITMTRGTKPNHRFTHWSVSGANGRATVNGNTIIIAAYTTTIHPHGNLTITANYRTSVATALNTSISALGSMQQEAVAPITITLDKRSGTGGTSSIISCKGFYISPTSVVPPTRAHHIFNGYFTAITGGIQRINSAGAYIALTNSTYTANVILYAQWTIVQYTITWRKFAGATTSNTLNYGLTSHAPATTADTAQWNYMWPVSSVVVITNQTIQEVRVLKKYRIIWKSFTGATLKSELINYNTTSWAPTTTADTAQWNYIWPKGHTIALSAETIQETRSLQIYTITWRNWNGALLGSSNIIYGGNGIPINPPARTGHVHTGWSVSYTNIIGPVITYAVFTINTYTVTFRNWNNTVLKIQTVNHGSNATAPPNPSRAGHTFTGWSGTFTNVTSNRTITAEFILSGFQGL